MKIRIELGWVHSKSAAKSFKSPACAELFLEYSKRISHFAPLESTGPSAFKGRAKARVWLCHPGKNSKELSSDELALKLREIQNSGVREWMVAIGDANGFNEKTIAEIKPDFLWSFGALTLPHELAAVVASEQIYRAFTILNHLPYHEGH